MLSRVADSIFWMARYTERTSNVLRVLRTNYLASQDEISDFNWLLLLNSYSQSDKDITDNIDNNSALVLENILLDKYNAASVYNNIIHARENARAVQDHITKEMWQCLNDYYHLVREDNLAEEIKSGDPVSLMDTMIRQSMFFHGTVDITMSRGEAFNYLNIGRFLERSLQSLHILDIKLRELDYDLNQPVEAPAWRYLLYSLSGYELYLKTHRGNLQADQVLQQILYNLNFPHSVLYCLQQLNRYFERLKPVSMEESYTRVEFLIGKAMNNLKYSSRKTASSDSLKELIVQTKRELAEIATAFNKYYFGSNF